MPVKLISWNVNGIRAALKKGFPEVFTRENPDILCLQETKATPDQVDYAFPPEYHAYWNSAEKKGYSGTAVFSRIEPEEVTMGIGVEEGDREGRTITMRFPEFSLVNVYTPNAKRELTRLDFRVNEWDAAFREHVCKLAEDRPVIFCGDLNVAHQEIDLKNARANRGNSGFTDEERESFTKHLEAGFIDTFREFEKGEGHYSWWTYRAGARERNIGWRIDYFLISEALRPRLQEAFILPDIFGSDHCPVGMVLG